MHHHAVTPLILTYNEEANIGRSLAALPWAERIVVIDSFSTDGTLSILRSDPRVEVHQRAFDDFATQCNFGLDRIGTEWVLSLDADYICPPELVDEIASLPDDPAEAGFKASFRYCIYGKALRGTLYPPRTVLYRRDDARYEQDGHAHRVTIDGPVGALQSRIDHDDRKPLASWFRAQRRYAHQEAQKLLSATPEELGFTDRLRLMKWPAPFLTPLYCLIRKGGLLDGRAGMFYALQRTYAEIALALELHEHEQISAVEPSRSVSALDAPGQQGPDDRPEDYSHPRSAVLQTAAPISES